MNSQAWPQAKTHSSEAGIESRGYLGIPPTTGPAGGFTASYAIETTGSQGPSGLATTSVGGETFDLNAFLGAGRYYGHSTPITGQNTIATNLEAGHIWNGHEALSHVTSFTQSAGAWGGGGVAPLSDRHATWAGLFIGGRQTVVNPSIRQQGIAYGTDLRSAAIATNWSGSAYALSFGISYDTLLTAYNASFGTADVINSSFSSRSPQDFGYFTSGTYVTVPGVRAAIDIAAPGESLTSGFYGGQTGGNNTSLAGSVNLGSSPTAYSAGIAGTSFAAPIVAGGAALVASAAKTLAPLAGNPNASQSMVVKSLLLTGADKTTGWNNGQQSVTVGGTSFIQTTQSLDWAAGAGRMNLDKTFDIQFNGQTDVSGSTGLLGSVARRGWDYGSSIRGTSNDYVIDAELTGNSTFTATLSWMRARDFDGAFLYEDAQADLGLSVWALDGGNRFSTLVARSDSQYNTVEHLSFTLPASGRYGLRVEYASNTFDNTGGQWGSASLPQMYGLAWTAVPEPATVILAGIAVAVTTWSRARRRFRR